MTGAIIIEGHIQGLANTRSLGKKGIPVFVVNSGKKCIAKHSKYCTAFFNSPPYHSNRLASFLISIAKTHNISKWLLLPSNDHAVMTISKNKDELSKYFTVLTPDKNTIDIIYDKYRLFEFAENKVIDVPRSWRLSDVNRENITFPVLIKGRYGLSFYKKTGKKVFECKNIKEYDYHTSSAKLGSIKDEIMIQELIPSTGKNPVISVAVFSVKGEVKSCWMGAKLREHPTKYGTATLAESIYREELYGYTKQIVDALSFDGICEIEYMLDPRDNKYKLIEINPRTWLWVDLAAKCGIDNVSMAWDYLSGKEPFYPQTYSTGIKWMNFYTDIYFSLKSIFTGQLSLRKYIRQSKGKKIPAVWDRKDPLPFFYLTALLPYLALNR